MDIKHQDIVLSIQLLKKEKILRSIQVLKLMAVVIVVFTIFIVYYQPSSSTNIFISLLAFLVVQIFVTNEYFELAKTSKKIRIINGGSYFQHRDTSVTWLVAAGVAVKDMYFILLLFFDASWLAHAYLYPVPANSYHQFLQQLTIGPITGTAFIWFTVLLWLIYMYLFVVGFIYTNEINFPEDINATKNTGNNTITPLEEVFIKVKTFSGDEIYLQGHHIDNRDKQPLILFPGFYQNGYVYDLSVEISLSRFLHQNGFDIWIVHPRGTAQSDGKKVKTSLDDFVSDDIPAVIDHVYRRTGIKPIFVGHSQGGIAAIISLMGAHKSSEGTVTLSDEKRNERQQNLQGLVTMGSFLDFSFSKKSWLENFVSDGLVMQIFGRKIRVIQSLSLIKIIKQFNFVGMPVSFGCRLALLENKALRVFLFPITWLLDFVAQLKIWEFLYHIPNMEKDIRRKLFYKTMDGTYSGILQQFYAAVAVKEMKSLDNKISYSVNYERLELPVSVVAMELDSLADPEMMQQRMVERMASKNKFYTMWNGVGHEDHFANPNYFEQVLVAIKNVC